MLFARCLVRGWGGLLFSCREVEFIRSCHVHISKIFCNNDGSLSGRATSTLNIQSSNQQFVSTIFCCQEIETYLRFPPIIRCIVQIWYEPVILKIGMSICPKQKVCQRLRLRLQLHLPLPISLVR